MRVLAPGRHEPGWAKECECLGTNETNRGGCGAHLLVEQSDLFSTTQGDDHFVTFECPECSAFTRVVSWPVPPGALPAYSKWKDRTSQK